MINKLYPLKFKPILKDKIWGGKKLDALLNKKSDSVTLGESWEISDVEGDNSRVVNGAFKNKSLKSLLEQYQSDLIGEKNYKVYGNKFPLLIKFIDAKEDLSIQLHPNDTLAAKRHNSFGKTEMWYVMQADDNANIIVGFNQEVTPEVYLQHLEDKTLTEILNFDKVKTGDAYFIDVGRVHAIGAGVLLAEIQQTSDITYRIYDWDRMDSEGNARELHNDLALEAINFKMKDDFRVQYSKAKNKSSEMVACPYFTVNHLLVTNKTLQKKNTFDSFIIYLCVDGAATIKVNNHSETLLKGETLLIPACFMSYEISAEKATLLEVYV
ncbi:type I phosphomannose isomerase catalytic subunit [Lacinutrix sp. Hel_I_90]|uniref:type I phosphomannose isomerase catalytic subunit n=1 Tax=Lacinutrix sp. Hel_I_90 TaxID=1249999 RepID=UPI0005CAA08A|nr:type I phosphomannose isomerase catalytic subunit [Lacinutrix sp. Hel_I_90]